MKIGTLAEVLNKTADELQLALNVENTNDDLPEEVIAKTLKDHLDLTVKEAKRIGRDEGQGRGVREFAKTIEKELKVIGAEGDDALMMIANIADKIKTDTGGDEKVKRQNEALKAKVDELTGKLTGIQMERETEKKHAVILTKISPMLEKYEGTQRAKEMALKNFMKDINAEIGDDDIYLIGADGKYKKNTFEEEAKAFFGELFEEKKPGGEKPPRNPDQKAQVKLSGRDRNTLLTAIRNAKTAEERLSLKEELDALNEASK